MRGRKLTVFLLVSLAIGIVAGSGAATAGFLLNNEKDRPDRLDAHLPWCFEPATDWVINLDDDAEVDECVLRALSGYWTQDHMEILRTVYNERLENMTAEEREKAIRKRDSRFIGWKQARR